MKIIGKTANGLLVDASEDELARILGYYSSYAVPNKSALNPGAEIEVQSLRADAGHQSGLAVVAVLHDRCVPRPLAFPADAMPAPAQT